MSDTSSLSSTTIPLSHYKVLNLYFAFPEKTELKLNNGYATFEFADEAYLVFRNKYLFGSYCSLHTTTNAKLNLQSKELTCRVTLYKNECKIDQKYHKWDPSIMYTMCSILPIDNTKNENFFGSEGFVVQIELYCWTDKSDVRELYINLFKLKDELLNK